MDLEYFRRLTKICRLKLDEKEEERLCQDVARVIEYVEVLHQLDTTGVAIVDGPFKEAVCPLRCDVFEKCMSTEDFLKNTVSKENRIYIPRILNPQF